jgi:hypothetical protein
MDHPNQRRVPAACIGWMWLGWLLTVQMAGEAQAQGTIIFSNKGPGLYAPITSYWDGSLLPAGNQYTVELWVGNGADSLRPVIQTHLSSPGVFGEGLPPVSVPGLPAGLPVAFQVFAWDNRGGTVNDKETAQSKMLLGLSAVYGPVFLGDADGDPAAPILAGLQSFWVPDVVPEPSVWALMLSGLAGVACCTYRRRR